jgi:hypothetical protein
MLSRNAVEAVAPPTSKGVMRKIKRVVRMMVEVVGFFSSYYLVLLHSQ